VEAVEAPIEPVSSDDSMIPPQAANPGSEPSDLIVPGKVSPEDANKEIQRLQKEIEEKTAPDKAPDKNASPNTPEKPVAPEK